VARKRGVEQDEERKKGGSDANRTLDRGEKERVRIGEEE